MAQFSGKTVLLILAILVLALFTQVFSLGWDTSGLTCLKHTYQHANQQYELIQFWHLRVYEHPVNYACEQLYSPKTQEFVPTNLTGSTQP